MRKWVILVLVVALAIPMMSVNAQDGEGFVSTFDLPTEPAAEGPLAGVDPTGQTITWWHQHGGARGEFLDEIIANFNAENPWGITVEASNQGGYGDQGGYVDGHLAFQTRMVLETVRGHQFNDLLGDRRPDAWNRLEGLETALGVDLSKGTVECLDGVSCLLVGPRLE